MKLPDINNFNTNEKIFDARYSDIIEFVDSSLQYMYNEYKHSSANNEIIDRFIRKLAIIVGDLNDELFDEDGNCILGRKERYCNAFAIITLYNIMYTHQFTLKTEETMMGKLSKVLEQFNAKRDVFIMLITSPCMTFSQILDKSEFSCNQIEQALSELLTDGIINLVWSNPESQPFYVVNYGYSQLFKENYVPPKPLYC